LHAVILSSPQIERIPYPCHKKKDEQAAQEGYAAHGIVAWYKAQLCFFDIYHCLVLAPDQCREHYRMLGQNDFLAISDADA
jgi:hypothetical protein